MSEEKKLNDQELARLNESYYEEKISSMKISYDKLLISKIEKELNLLSANYTLKNKELENARELLSKSKDALKEQKGKHQTLLDTISERLGLKSKWGFDPLSGEIKE